MPKLLPLVAEAPIVYPETVAEAYDEVPVLYTVAEALLGSMAAAQKTTTRESARLDSFFNTDFFTEMLLSKSTCFGFRIPFRLFYTMLHSTLHKNRSQTYSYLMILL